MSVRFCLQLNDFYHFYSVGIDVETGDTVKCFVIDIDMEDWLFIGTLQPEILDFADSQRGKVCFSIFFSASLAPHNLVVDEMKTI